MSPVSTSSISRTSRRRRRLFQGHLPTTLLKLEAFPRGTDKTKKSPRRSFEEANNVEAMPPHLGEIKNLMEATKKVQHICSLGCEEAIGARFLFPITEAASTSEIDLGSINYISIRDVLEMSKKLEESFEMGSNLEGTKVAGVNETSKPVGIKMLDFASYMNGGVFYMAMTLCAVSGAGLFSWEQSPETPSFDPKVPVTLYWITILCLLALPLSLTALDEIKQLAAQVQNCAEMKSDGAEATHQGATTSPEEMRRKRDRSGGGEASHDPEKCQRSKGICQCIQCMPKIRKFLLYGVLYLAPFFTALAFMLSLASLTILMFATESHNTAKFAVMCCLPTKFTFLGGIVWLACRKWKSIAQN